MLNVLSSGLPGVDTMKRLAKNLEKKYEYPHYLALEHIAVMFGYKSWEEIQSQATTSFMVDLNSASDEIAKNLDENLQIRNAKYEKMIKGLPPEPSGRKRIGLSRRQA